MRSENKARLNISVDPEELELIRSVVPSRKLSRFIISAAAAKARELKRDALRRQILEAYEADPGFLQNAGAEWDTVSEESWPEA